MDDEKFFDKFFKGMVIAIITIAVLGLISYGIVGYIILHFIHKVW